MKALQRTAVLLMAVTLIIGCSLLPNHKDDFGKLNDDFMHRFRWHDVNGAAQHVAPEKREEFLDRFEALDDLKVTSFEATRLEAQVQNSLERTVHYRLSYYLMPSMSVKQKRFTLRWRQPVEGGDWLMVDEFPALD